MHHGVEAAFDRLLLHVVSRGISSDHHSCRSALACTASVYHRIGSVAVMRILPASARFRATTWTRPGLGPQAARSGATAATDHSLFGMAKGLCGGAGAIAAGSTLRLALCLDPVAECSPASPQPQWVSASRI
jgi:hypothetical protein